MPSLAVDELQRWTRDLLAASGVPEKQARDAAEVYALATLRGMGHHDLSYLPQRLEWLRSGKVTAAVNLRLVSQMGGTEVWDGGGGLGEALCHHITLRAMDLARTHGVGYACVRHSNHFLAAAPYVELGAREGFLILVWSNTDAGMAFPGGHSRQIGNNPLGWGVGTGDQSLSADLCLAYSSLGNLNTLAAQGQATPEHWGRDADGQPTTSPSALLAGGIEPIGGHKGLALALLGEVLTGVLAGGTTLDQIAPGGGLNTHNQMVLAWNLEAFGGVAEVGARVDSLRKRALALAPSGRLPGDRSRAAAQELLSAGVVLPTQLSQDLRRWSHDLGVPVPAQLSVE